MVSFDGVLHELIRLVRKCKLNYFFLLLTEFTQ